MTLARRKSRHWHPDVMTAIHDELLTGASASGVLDKLYSRQGLGEFRDKDGVELSLPSTRTIQDIAKSWARDASGTWQLTDSGSDDVPIILDVLAAVIERSEGRIHSLTKNEAQLIPSLVKAGRDRLTPWVAYRLARFYLYWTARESDDRELVTYLAFLADPDRLERNVAAGRVSGRDMLQEILRWSGEGIEEPLK